MRKLALADRNAMSLARIIRRLMALPATVAQLRDEFGTGDEQTRDFLKVLQAQGLVHVLSWDTSTARPAALWAWQAHPGMLPDAIYTPKNSKPKSVLPPQCSDVAANMLTQWSANSSNRSPALQT